jgi:thiol-disulfide isomerase/thioredoxin
VIKSTTIALVLAIFMVSCVSTTNKQDIVILNNTNDIIEVDVYNTWSGKTIAKWILQKGINKTTLNKSNLYGFYAKGFPEKTFYAHNNTSITFQNEEVLLDTINQDINAHIIWSQQIITGESQSIFHWNENSLNLQSINDWKTFDSILYKITENPDYKIAKGALASKHLLSYPAAYPLIDNIFKNQEVSLNKKMQKLSIDLRESKINSEVQNKFLSHYLMPHKVNLRNDSIIDLTEKYFPPTYTLLKPIYDSLQANAIIKVGDLFPDFISEGETIKIQDLTKNYKYTLIDFWATWCIPCIKQMPHMNKYAIELDNEIQFVSLSVDNQKDYKKWTEIAQEYKSITHFWLSDTTDIRKNLGVKGLPRMILLDNKGNIVDPDFPHLYEPIAHEWIKSLARQKKTKNN